MKKIELEAKERSEIGKKSSAVRQRGGIPAIVYGKGMKSTPVEIDYKHFKKAISGDAGTNVLITLKLSKDKTLPVITHDIQRNPLNDNIIHVDFHKIQMNKALRTKVHIEVKGMAIGVKEEKGILVHPMKEIEIECLPSEIPDKINVDVTNLKINQSIHVSDLPTPKGVIFVTPSTELVVSVSPPTKEEEVAPPTAEEAAAVEGAEAAAPAAEGQAAQKAPTEKAPKAEGKGAEKPQKEAKK